MRITDTHSIEGLAAAQLAATDNALIAIDAKDYERMKVKLGSPSVAVNTGETDNVDSLCQSIRDELSEAELEQTKGILLLVRTSRERGMTMNDLLRVDSLFRALPEAGCFMRGLWYDLPEGKCRITAILWK